MPCRLRHLCKHYEEEDPACPTITSVGGRIRVIRPRKQRQIKEEYTEGGVSVKEYKKARIYIRDHKNALTHEQELALDAFKGKHLNSLTDVQRQQVINIAQDMKKK